MITWIIRIFAILIALLSLIFILAALVPKMILIVTALIEFILQVISSICIHIATSMIIWLGIKINNSELVAIAMKLRKDLM